MGCGSSRTATPKEESCTSEHEQQVGELPEVVTDGDEDRPLYADSTMPSALATAQVVNCSDPLTQDASVIEDDPARSAHDVATQEDTLDVTEPLLVSKPTVPLQDCATVSGTEGEPAEGPGAWTTSVLVTAPPARKMEGDTEDAVVSPVPGVVSVARSPLSPDAVEVYHEELLSFVKGHRGVGAAQSGPQIQYEADGLTPVDPSKMGGWTDPLKEDAFGGTKEMADAEKDFAQALRGGLDGATVSTGKTIRAELPSRPTGYLESQGRWIRTMNQQRTCYLYIHTYTQAQQSTRPEGAGPYPEDEIEAQAAAATEAAQQAAAAKAAAEAAAFPSAPVAGLRAVVNEIAGKGKVPLLLATGAAYAAALGEILCWDGRGLDQRAWLADHDRLLAQQREECAVYTAKRTEEQAQKIAEWNEETAARKSERRVTDGDSYEDSDEECPDFDVEPYKADWDGTYHLDMAPFVLPFRRSKIKFDDHIEECRKKLWRSMVAGGTAIFDLKDLSPNFIDKIGAKKYKGAVPATLFDPTKNAISAAKGIFVRAKGDPAPIVAPGFQVVILAQQKPKTFAKELKESFDAYWDNLEARRVLPP
mmetsp:Transcript_30088/g.78969  ORF Transcript_30088/g.78969 Transcript_30088/m.78969 type:complete len:590 (+) Transcript_30088:158-1927(+)